jgi:hypothetical protein
MHGDGDAGLGTRSSHSRPRALCVTIRHADGTEERRERIPDTPEVRRAVDRAAWYMLARNDVRWIWVECEEEE